MKQHVFLAKMLTAIAFSSLLRCIISFLSKQSSSRSENVSKGERSVGAVFLNKSIVLCQNKEQLTLGVYSSKFFLIYDAFDLRCFADARLSLFNFIGHGAQPNN